MASGSSLVGTLLAGRYRLDRMVGQGGMGSVFAARDVQVGERLVAVKVLAAHLAEDDTQVQRFEQEAHIANQLRHPNTISLLDFGRGEDGVPYMALEFLHGRTLTEVLREGALEPARALHIARQVLKSLAEAHAAGILHRDLKPDNLFLCDIHGEHDFVKVIDFGIAKLTDRSAELTEAGKMFGTPRYLSPEQAQGLPLSPPSDLYALGVILFEMLAGRVPFDGDDPMAIAMQHVEIPAPALHEAVMGLAVPEALERLVARLLAKAPADRPQRAEEALAELDACAKGLDGPAASETTAPVPADTPLGVPPLRKPPTPSKPRTVPPLAAVKPQFLAEEDKTRTLTAAGEDQSVGGVAAEPASAAAPDGRQGTLVLDASENGAGAGDAGLDHAGQQQVAQRRARDGRQEPGREPGKPRTRAGGAADAREPAAAARAHALTLVAVAVTLAAAGGGLAWWWQQRAEPSPAASASAAQTPAANARGDEDRARTANPAATGLPATAAPVPTPAVAPPPTLPGSTASEGSHAAADSPSQEPAQVAAPVQPAVAPTPSVPSVAAAGPAKPGVRSVAPKAAARKPKIEW